MDILDALRRETAAGRDLVLYDDRPSRVLELSRAASVLLPSYRGAADASSSADPPPLPLDTPVPLWTARGQQLTLLPVVYVWLTRQQAMGQYVAGVSRHSMVNVTTRERSELIDFLSNQRPLRSLLRASTGTAAVSADDARPASFLPAPHPAEDTLATGTGTVGSAAEVAPLSATDSEPPHSRLLDTAAQHQQQLQQLQQQQQQQNDLSSQYAAAAAINDAVNNNMATKAEHQENQMHETTKNDYQNDDIPDSAAGALHSGQAQEKGGQPSSSSILSALSAQKNASSSSAAASETFAVPERRRHEDGGGALLDSFAVASGRSMESKFDSSDVTIASLYSDVVSSFDIMGTSYSSAGGTAGAFDSTSRPHASDGSRILQDEIGTGNREGEEKLRRVLAAEYCIRSRKNYLTPSGNRTFFELKQKCADIFQTVLHHPGNGSHTSKDSLRKSQNSLLKTSADGRSADFHGNGHSKRDGSYPYTVPTSSNRHGHNSSSGSSSLVASSLSRSGQAGKSASGGHVLTHGDKISAAGASGAGTPSYGHTASGAALAATGGMMMRPSVVREPIIVVPPSVGSLINIVNAKAFLESAIFEPPSEERARKAIKMPHVEIQRKAGVSSLRRPWKLMIVDSVDNISEADWPRVVAVFVTGQSWQFKSWRWQEPVEIFQHVRGYFLKYADEQVKHPITSWNVKVLSVNRTKRHLDLPLTIEFWSDLEKWVAVNRPEVMP